MQLLLVIGAGPGNSRAAARRFGAEGYEIALVGRNPEHLRKEVESLAAESVVAHPYQGDASDADSIRDAVAAVRNDHGPIAAVVFAAYRSGDVTDVLAADPRSVDEAFRVGVAGLLGVVQATRDDLRATAGAVLVLNGAAGNDHPDADSFATSFGVDGIALESAAKSKLVGLLAERLRPEGVYVGELIINGTVKGSPYASATAIDPAEIAEALWAMATARRETRTHIAESA